MAKLTITLIILAVACATLAAAARSHTEFSRRYIPNHKYKDHHRRLLKEHEENPTNETHRRILAAPTLPYVVAITDWVPMVNCGPDWTNTSNYTGYAWDFMKLIAGEQGWNLAPTPPTLPDMTFQCVTEEDAMGMLKNDTAQMAIGRFVVSSDTITKGFTFSQPFYPSGLKIVGKKIFERDAWSFLYPITVEVGMAFIVMTILVAFSIWLFEEQSVKRPFMHHVLNFNEVFYDSLASYFYTNAIELKRLASKLLQWMFWFVLFVFLSLYQADLTAIYSNNYFRRNFRSLDDGINLGYKIAVPSVYRNYFLNTLYDESLVYYDALPGENILATSQRIATDLLAGNITGAILENPVADYIMTTQCDIYDIEDQYIAFDYAVMFKYAQDATFVASITQTIVRLNEQNSVQLLKKSYFDLSPSIDCTNADTKISLQTMGGLWVIFACTLIISMVIFAFKKLQLFKFPESYFPPYYQYYTPKTQVFENQLKESVDQQISQILSTYESQLKDEISSFEKGLLYTPLKTDDVKDVGEPDIQELNQGEPNDDLKIDSPAPHKELKIMFMNEEKPSADPEGDAPGDGQGDGQEEPQI